jgi:superfamily II DNA or RNA helicase
MLITFPSILTVDELRSGNRVRQIGERSLRAEGAFIPFVHGRLHGFLFRSAESGDETLVVPPKTKQVPENHLRVIEATVPSTNGDVDLTNGTWVRHPLQNRFRAGTFDYGREMEEVLESWSGGFSYVQEDAAHDIKGLRGPQIGAVHAVHAHWSVSDAPGTIVMPTGTGKTDAMLSILVSVLCPKLLVIVPTDALRTQIAEKFLTLGILKEPGCTILRQGVKYPIVGVLQHIPRSAAEVDDIFGRCQVIVMTSSIAGQCDTTVQNRMSHHCPYLFIDEAHHAEAPTWSAFKERFKGRRVLQFTATPFREDGKPLDGDIIFKYPLKKAQQEGYFKPIHFRPVVEFNRKRSDAAIATKAIEQLRADFDKGHVLMARVENVARAKDIFELYNQHPEFKPVQLHTGIKSARQREVIRRQIISGESRIVVCVDMLGEGFDLPELKIAAFHDIRKTLAVTLQLAGRFTRSRPDLGNATFIANTADVHVQDELRRLYTRDPDWNALLPELSDTMVGEQLSLQEFLRGFTQFTKEIPLKTVRPATSAVVYRTRCTDWAPENFKAGIPGLNACEQVHEAINHAEHTLVVVTARRVPLQWSDVETLFSWEWELYVVIWSPDQNLLFINSSTNSGEYRALAQAVAGEGAILIKGQEVFRTFAGVNRLQLQQVGLTEQLGRNVRYTGRMGADVAPALPEVHLRRARKSVLSGTGYEGGQRTTVGASRKGRIWSHRRDRVDQLAAWCKKIGTKLLDNTINPDEVLKGTLDAKTITERPSKIPIGIDWPEEIYKTPEAIWSIVFNGQERLLSEVSIEIVSPTLIGSLKFAIASETERTELELELVEEEFEEERTPNYRFVMRDDKTVYVRRGGAEGEEICAFFYDNPPIAWFADGSSLEGNQYVELKSIHPPYDIARIQAWDWTGIDLKKESQGEDKDASSIQARVIRELKNGNYVMIIDDDGKGEAADIVAIRLAGDQAAPSSIDVEFYHCKYSQGAAAGQRIKDLYEVCGQAQKSIYWMSSPEKRTDLFTHLLRREADRQEAGRASRFEVGDKELLLTIREMSRLCPVTLKIYIVQPGVSKARATRDQLQLMSVTENYLLETYQLPFGVIASE